MELSDFTVHKSLKSKVEKNKFTGQRQTFLNRFSCTDAEAIHGTSGSHTCKKLGLMEADSSSYVAEG